MKIKFTDTIFLIFDNRERKFVKNDLGDMTTNPHEAMWFKTEKMALSVLQGFHSPDPEVHSIWKTSRSYETIVTRNESFVSIASAWDTEGMYDVSIS